MDEPCNFNMISKGFKFPENWYKCDHFLKFYFSNGLLQDVACGTTKLKYTTGKLK